MYLHYDGEIIIIALREREALILTRTPADRISNQNTVNGSSLEPIPGVHYMQTQPLLHIYRLATTSSPRDLAIIV